MVTFIHRMLFVNFVHCSHTFVVGVMSMEFVILIVMMIQYPSYFNSFSHVNGQRHATFNLCL